MASKGKTLKLLNSHLLTQFDDNNNNNNNSNNNTNMFDEFEESEIWHSDLSTTMDEAKAPTSHCHKHSSRRRSNNNVVATSKPPSRRTTCSSLPVNIPDWSKVYGKEKELYGDDEDTDHDQYNWDDEEDNDIVSEGCGNGFRVPPHEYLARQRGASFSVHEGKGRTLKGRDLRQVRNAVWEKIGFAD